MGVPKWNHMVFKTLHHILKLIEHILFISFAAVTNGHDYETTIIPITLLQ